MCIEAVKAAPGWVERFCPTSAPPSHPHPLGAGGADAAPASPNSRGWGARSLWGHKTSRIPPSSVIPHHQEAENAPGHSSLRAGTPGKALLGAGTGQLGVLGAFLSPEFIPRELHRAPQHLEHPITPAPSTPAPSPPTPSEYSGEAAAPRGRAAPQPQRCARHPDKRSITNFAAAAARVFFQ